MPEWQIWRTRNKLRATEAFQEVLSRSIAACRAPDHTSARMNVHRIDRIITIGIQKGTY